MTPDQARTIIEEALTQIVPDADIAALDEAADLREALGLDSLDFLDLVEILSDRTGHRIDEDDYPKLATLKAGVSFLTTRG